MDINDLRGISTAFLLLAFVGLVIWAFSKRRKKEFDEAANLPFADEDISQDGNKAEKGNRP
jgi:cytochrome c oxidase cbb3-type subunit 4